MMPATNRRRGGFYIGSVEGCGEGVSIAGEDCRLFVGMLLFTSASIVDSGGIRTARIPVPWKHQ